MNYPINNYTSGPAYYGQGFPVQQRGIAAVAQIPMESFDSYPVAAGTTAVLFDFEKSVFCLKATDVYGRPLPLEPYTFNKIDITKQPDNAAQSPPQNQNEYVTKEDYEKLVAAVAEQGKALNGLLKELNG